MITAARCGGDGGRQYLERRGGAGTPVADWRAFDLARVTARLSINGREVGSGNGGDVMGHPLNALGWLADKLATAGTAVAARHGRDDRQHGPDPVSRPPATGLLVEVSGLGTAELAVT